MTHPKLEMLLAHVDGELTTAESSDLARHMTRCTTCFAAAARLRETSGLFAGALGVLDGGEPASWRGTPARSTDARELVFALPADRMRAPAQRLRRPDTRMLRRAAMFLGVTAAAGSAAVLGGRALLTQSGPVESLTVEGAPAVPTVAAVSVTPAAGRIHVALAAAAGVRVSVVLAAVRDGSVAIENAVAPHVTVSGNRVTVEVRDAAAVVRITLPEDLQEADVVAGGVVLIRVRAGVVTPAAAASGGVMIGSSTPSAP